jgi:hypothetical protein
MPRSYGFTQMVVKRNQKPSIVLYWVKPYLTVMLRRLPLYLSLLLLTQCSRCKRDDPQPPKDPLSLLPPETAVGKGTFACLVNGQAYVALYTTSANGDRPSFTHLGVAGDMRRNGEEGAEKISMGVVLEGQLLNNQSFAIISSATPFPIFTPGINQFIARVANLPCVYDGKYIKTGRVDLVQFDGERRIAAGRFAFTLYEPGVKF